MLRVAVGLFAAESEPDQIDRPADSYKQAGQSEVPGVEPLIQGDSDASPEDQPRKEVSKDGPHCILFTVSHGNSLPRGGKSTAACWTQEGANVGEVSCNWQFRPIAMRWSAPRR